jgi:hypothetical protein
MSDRINVGGAPASIEQEFDAPASAWTPQYWGGPASTLFSSTGAVVLAAGALVVTLTAPVATPHAAVTLPAGGNTITLSAPSATALAATTVPAGGNTVTLTAPVAVLSQGTLLEAGGLSITFSAPDAGIQRSAPPVSQEGGGVGGYRQAPGAFNDVDRDDEDSLFLM